MFRFVVLRVSIDSGPVNRKRSNVFFVVKAETFDEVGHRSSVVQLVPCNHDLVGSDPRPGFVLFLSSQLYPLNRVATLFIFFKSILNLDLQLGAIQA